MRVSLSRHQGLPAERHTRVSLFTENGTTPRTAPLPELIDALKSAVDKGNPGDIAFELSNIKYIINEDYTNVNVLLNAGIMLLLDDIVGNEEFIQRFGDNFVLFIRTLTEMDGFQVGTLATPRFLGQMGVIIGVMRRRKELAIDLLSRVFGSGELAVFQFVRFGMIGTLVALFDGCGAPMIQEAILATYGSIVAGLTEELLDESEALFDLICRLVNGGFVSVYLVRLLRRVIENPITRCFMHDFVRIQFGCVYEMLAVADDMTRCAIYELVAVCFQLRCTECVRDVQTAFTWRAVVKDMTGGDSVVLSVLQLSDVIIAHGYNNDEMLRRGIVPALECLIEGGSCRVKVAALKVLTAFVKNQQFRDIAVHLVRDTDYMTQLSIFLDLDVTDGDLVDSVIKSLFYLLHFHFNEPHGDAQVEIANFFDRESITQRLEVLQDIVCESTRVYIIQFLTLYRVQYCNVTSQ